MLAIAPSVTVRPACPATQLRWLLDYAAEEHVEIEFWSVSGLSMYLRKSFKGRTLPDALAAAVDTLWTGRPAVGDPHGKLGARPTTFDGYQQLVAGLTVALSTPGIHLYGDPRYQMPWRTSHPDFGEHAHPDLRSAINGLTGGCGT